MTDNIIYRPFQRRWLTALENKIDQGEKVLFGNIHPGSGKTLASQVALNELYRRGLIDTAVVLTPRLNLCQQYELDWMAIRPDLGDPKISSLVHRENVEPLLRSGQFGYVTTYQSLMSQPNIHFKFFREHQGRIALVVDESHQLGDGTLYGSDATSTRLVRELTDFTEFVMSVSGTVARSDGTPVYLGTYTEPDESGICHLEADVEATYQEGVKEKYLREFEFELFDGRAIYEYLDGELEHLQLSEMRRGLYKVVRHPSYWQPAVQMAVARVREMQTYDKRFCGVIGADSQDMAKDIVTYCVEVLKARTLLAVSNEKLAHDNLRKFKNGNYDVLVTVGMAHIGYDYKPITVVACLNSIRWPGWLDQFFARGMRTMKDIAYELQTCWAIGPDDKLMVAYVKDKQRQSQQGVKMREPRPVPPPPPPQERFGDTIWAEQDGVEALGVTTEMFATSQEYEEYASHKETYKLGAVRPSGLITLIRDIKKGNGSEEKHTEKTPFPSDPPRKTEQEKEKEYRLAIHRKANHADKLLGIPDGTSAKFMYRYFGNSTTKIGLEDLKYRLDWVDHKWTAAIHAGNITAGYVQDIVDRGARLDDSELQARLA